MAATAVRPDRAVTARFAIPGGVLRSESRSSMALGLALGVAVLYAMFAEGAIGIPQESVLQIGVAAIALVTLAVLLFGRGLRASAAPMALAGLAMLAGFAAWSGLSIAWSISPDQSWLEANRALAYGLVAALALVLGSSLPRAAERVALGYLAIATLVALYALGGKLFPWVEIPGILDLDHADRFSRLRSPLGYWNALGLACAMAVPIGLRAVVTLTGRARTAALLSLVVVLATLALTYSRGGLLVLAVMVGLLVAVGPDRLRLLAVGGVALLGAAPAVVCVVLLDDLKTDGLSTSARSGDGLLLAVALAIGLAIAFLLARRVFARGELRLSDRAVGRVRKTALVAAVAVPLIVLGALALSDRGIGGTIDNQLDEFTAAKFDPQNDPSRVLRTNSGNRWVWWQEAVGAFSDRPVEGHGAGSFPLLHRAYRDNGIEVRQPHSVPLEFLAETGLVGALLALGGLALLGAAGVRTVRARGPGRDRAFAVTLLAVALGWLLHSLVDWDWDIPAVTLVAVIALGVLCARPRAEGAAPPRPPAARGPLLAAGAVAAFAVAALAALPALSQQLTDEALARASGGTAADLREAQETAALAKRLNPLAVEPVFAQAAIAERGNQPAAAAGLLVEAVERQPSNPSAWTRLARFQIAVGDSRGALRSILIAASLDRRGLTVTYLSSQALYDQNRSASATGTPLPERLGPVPAPSAAPVLPDDTTSDSPAHTPTPAPPAPTPAPTPVPAPPREQPSPPPQDDEGDPFRLEG
jgi:hypothetical protein